MSNEVVIVSAVRSAIGSLKDVPAVDLADTVIKEALIRAGVEAKAVDEVIMGKCSSIWFGAKSSEVGGN